MKLPYEKRVPLPWTGDDAPMLDAAIKALGRESVAFASAEADEHAQAVWAGREQPHYPYREAGIPQTEQELAHYREAVWRDYLSDALLEQIQEEGEIVDCYEWTGEGVATSPGSSFYACVKEWRGFYLYYDEVNSEGPYLGSEKPLDILRKLKENEPDEDWEPDTD